MEKTADASGSNKKLLNKHLVSLLIAAEATGTTVGGRKHAALSVDALSVNAIVRLTCDCLTQSELLFSIGISVKIKTNREKRRAST